MQNSMSFYNYAHDLFINIFVGGRNSIAQITVRGKKVIGYTKKLELMSAKSPENSGLNESF